MNYITVEEFLKQSDKVQNELWGWWKPQRGDLFSLICPKGIGALDGTEDTKEGFIPLLQMHQLIQFIEDKTNKKLEIQFIKNNYFVNIVEKYTIEKQYIKLGNNLLEALWKVTIQIIED